MIVIFNIIFLLFSINSTTIIAALT